MGRRAAAQGVWTRTACGGGAVLAVRRSDDRCRQGTMTAVTAGTNGGADGERKEQLTPLPCSHDPVDSRSAGHPLPVQQQGWTPASRLRLVRIRSWPLPQGVASCRCGAGSWDSPPLPTAAHRSSIDEMASISQRPPLSALSYQLSAISSAISCPFHIQSDHYQLSKAVESTAWLILAQLDGERADGSLAMRSVHRPLCSSTSAGPTTSAAQRQQQQHSGSRIRPRMQLRSSVRHSAPRLLSAPAADARSRRQDHSRAHSSSLSP